MSLTKRSLCLLTLQPAVKETKPKEGYNYLQPALALPSRLPQHDHGPSLQYLTCNKG
jgi:hypothetical protein